MSAKSSDVGGSDLGLRSSTKVYTVTLTTNSYKFAGVGHNAVLIQWLAPSEVEARDGSAEWSDEVLFNHKDIEPGEVVAKTFTITGRPQALRLTNRSMDGYVFDKLSVQEEGEDILVAQRTPQSRRGWGTLLSNKRDDWFGARESMEFQMRMLCVFAGGGRDARCRCLSHPPERAIGVFGAFVFCSIYWGQSRT